MVYIYIWGTEIDYYESFGFMLVNSDSIKKNLTSNQSVRVEKS